MDTATIEKDAIVFLGLLSIAYRNFDEQFKHADGEITHHKGLNIFAAIIDNEDGEVIAQQQNNIHASCNPMMHAEQMSLKEAITKLQSKRKRDDATTSVENYYRQLLFNQPNTVGNFNVGSTIYTTLEPCPFCTSALLVTRMKRIVYIIPDSTYGNSFSFLKDTFYKSYDITYSNIRIPIYSDSKLITFCGAKLKWLIDYVESYPQNATLYLDYLKSFLKECSDYFLQLNEKDLISANKIKNLRTLNELQEKLTSIK